MDDRSASSQVITVTDLRERTSEIIRRVAQGETFIVRLYARQVAVLAPVGAVDTRPPLKETSMNHPPLRPATAVLYNQAGGSCKTSLVRDLAYDASQRGLRVLVIDADPQGSLTRWLGGYEILDSRGRPVAEQLGRTIFDVITGRCDDFPEPLSLHGFDLIPCNRDVEAAAAYLGNAVRSEPMARLRGAVDLLAGKYDLVFFDTPPADNALVRSCMAAADYVFTPVTASKGLDRIDTIMDGLRFAREINPGLKFGGFIPANMPLRRAKGSGDEEYQAGHFQEVLALLKEDDSPYAQLGPTLGVIKARPGLFNDAAAVMKPVAVYRPNHEVVAEIAQVADEVYAIMGFTAAEDDAGVAEGVA